MIKLIVNVYNSRADVYGNSYWAMMVTDTESGESVVGILGGSARGNAAHYVRGLGYEWSDIHISETEFPIRQFNRKVKGWPYIGNAQDIRALFGKLGVRV